MLSKSHETIPVRKGMPYLQKRDALCRGNRNLAINTPGLPATQKMKDTKTGR
jgi:hypothetical protein